MGTFNMGNDKYMTCKMGSIVPIQMHEVLPGDVWKMRTKAMIRLAPLAAPVMQKVKVRIHHWFVPNRLVWTNWEKFITGGEDGMDASVFPYVNVTESLGQSTLADYLGIPEGVASGTHISALPFRAYSLIWNNFYRDQDFQNELVISKADGADSTTNRALQQACWDKDIFTTARDSTMKGPAVTIPISGGPAAVSGEIETDDTDVQWRGATSSNQGTIQFANDGTNRFMPSNYATATNGENFTFGDNTGLQLEDGEADTDDLYLQIPDLRLGAALARYEENRSRFGGRYVDYLNFLGVGYSDSRLQRPEYLGGDQGVISMSEVLQTSPNSADGDTESAGVGSMLGHGISAFGRQGIKYRAEEHGYIMSFMIVMPDSQYGNGIHKSWSRFTKEDFWQQELEHIGQEWILNKELYAASAEGYDPEGNWGAVDRYQHYREATNYPAVAGEMRDALAFWHMVRLADPDSPLPIPLNEDFVKCVPTTRIYQATWEDQLWCKIDNRAKVRRLVTANARPVLF